MCCCPRSCDSNVKHRIKVSSKSIPVLVVRRIDECMNQLLFERSTGNVGPNVFARLHTSQLVTSLCSAPQHRFDGGERGTAVHDGEIDPGHHIWAHQSGINALALERFEGRM